MSGGDAYQARRDFVPSCVTSTRRRPCVPPPFADSSGLQHRRSICANCDQSLICVGGKNRLAALLRAHLYCPQFSRHHVRTNRARKRTAGSRDDRVRLGGTSPQDPALPTVLVPSCAANTASKCVRTRSRAKDCETLFRPLNFAQNRTFVQLATNWDPFSQAGRRRFESDRPIS